MNFTKPRLTFNKLLWCLLFCGCPKMPPIMTCLTDMPHGKFFCTSRENVDFDVTILNPAGANCLPDFEKLLYHCAGKDVPLFNPLIDKHVTIPFSDYGIVLDYCTALKGS